jgi:DNA replication protein DnaC
MRKMPMKAAEDLLEIVMRRYERASTLLTSNRPVEDWGKLLGNSAAVTACSTACFTTDMYSNAVREAGAQKQICLRNRRQSRTISSRTAFVHGRFCTDHAWPLMR